MRDTSSWVGPSPGRCSEATRGECSAREDVWPRRCLLVNGGGPLPCSATAVERRRYERSRCPTCPPDPQIESAQGAESSSTFEPSAGQQSDVVRSEEHTSELQSLMRISYAVFCLT